MIGTVPKQSFFRRHWPSCTLAALLVVVAVIVLALPKVVRSSRHTQLLDALNHVRQMNILLIDFQADYGSYPNEKTAAEFAGKNHAYASELGTESSNDFFRQFFAVDFIESEEIFYAKVRGSRRPDGQLGAGEAIAKGECGFAYVLWEDALKIPDEGPLLITPMIPGKREFDYELSKEHYGKKVVILRADGMVETLRINSD
ncbi:MAG: hypothetical protein R3242_09505, partial [Akkermansiaceae bacterium]|nr:hypothetical protein [Akkermansiaceae bacterium]